MGDMNDSKVVLITGCGRGGIGYEYCRAFADKRCRVYATDISSRLPEISALTSENIEALELNVTSDESVDSAVDTIISKHGRIDVVVNNAGIGSFGPLSELPLEAIKKAWEINTLGQLRLVQKVVPYMAQQHSGRIVNIGSVVGKVSTPWAGSYGSSKAAVHSMSNTLRLELKPFGIDVILVLPGSVRSTFASASMQTASSYDWKLYKEFKDSIAARATASQSGKATDARVFATHVVKKVLSPRPLRQIVFGHLTGLFGVLACSPLWLRDSYFTNRFNLNKQV